MYSWKIEYVLKNGVRLNALYKGPENNSDKVLNKLFAVSFTSLVPTYGENEQEVIAVMMGEIAAIRIMPA